MADQPFGVADPDNGVNRMWLRRPVGFAQGAFYNMRDQVFHALFYRLAVIYSRSVPRSCRRAIEFLMLFEALIALGIFTYVHFAFNRDPANCLGEISGNWSRDGVLRVEVKTNTSLLSEYTLDDSYDKEYLMYGSEVESDYMETSNETSNSTEESVGQLEQDEGSWHDGLSFEWLSWIEERGSSHSLLNGTYTKFMKVLNYLLTVENELEPGIEDVYIYEYASEFGFLRMSPKTRHKLNITTTFIVLDPRKESCFGNVFGKALLSEFLGYDDVLLYSLKHVAGDRPHKGYCRNVATGDYYKFVDMSVSRFSYIPAAFLLVLFTTSISMLLRYSHQQIFIFMVDVLRVLDRTVIAMFPFAPLLTAVLALIGVETLISELFTEASTGFYVILIVWLADQYNVVCCHTIISRRHWIRFFYLYHFIFYAYHYRFNGHFSFVALTTSWLFIQHSMIYFFHHYELPAIEHQTQVHSLLARVHHRTPVRGLVTVISQTSPTEISRFTLDTRTTQPVAQLDPERTASSNTESESAVEAMQVTSQSDPERTASSNSESESAVEAMQVTSQPDPERTASSNSESESAVEAMQVTSQPDPERTASSNTESESAIEAMQVTSQPDPERTASSNSESESAIEAMQMTSQPDPERTNSLILDSEILVPSTVSSEMSVPSTVVSTEHISATENVDLQHQSVSPTTRRIDSETIIATLIEPANVAVAVSLTLPSRSLTSSTVTSVASADQFLSQTVASISSNALSELNAGESKAINVGPCDVKQGHSVVNNLDINDAVPVYNTPDIDSTVPVYNKTNIDSTVPVYNTPDIDSTVPVYNTPDIDSTVPVYNTPDIDSTVPVYNKTNIDSTVPVHNAQGLDIDSTVPVYNSPDIDSTAPVYNSPDIDSAVPVYNSPDIDSTAPVYNSPDIDSAVPVYNSPDIDSAVPVYNSPDIDSTAPVYNSPDIDSTAPVYNSPDIDSAVPVYNSPDIDSTVPVYNSPDIDSTAPVYNSPDIDSAVPVYNSPDI